MLAFVAFVSYAYADEAVNAGIQDFTEAPRDVVTFEDKKFNVTIKDVNVLSAGDKDIQLWGIEKVNPNAAVFNLKARSKLEKKIGDASVLCTIKARDNNVIQGQCINQSEEDLSLYLLQQGFVSADRPAINGTVFERAYLAAEQNAQDNGLGVWSVDGSYASAAETQTQNFMLGAFVLMAVFILGLFVLGFFVVRGFKKVADVQNQSLDLAMKERTLKGKEKLVIAAMIKAEVIENKTKIEAYLVIYEEMLQDLSDSTKAPKYQKTGEIIQKQPALSRSVFDGNTNKLDLFGGELSSQVIHYYARIKSAPDYVEIVSDTPQAEFKETIQVAVDTAKKLYEISNELLQSFEHNALARDVD